FVLLGDPALRLPGTDEIRLDVPKSVSVGQKLTVRGVLPAGMKTANVEVSLERSPASVPAGLGALPRQPGGARDKAMRNNHDQANQFTLVTKTVKSKDGKFEVELQTSGDLTAGGYVVRAYAVTKKRDALAARRVEVRKGQ